MSGLQRRETLIVKLKHGTLEEEQKGDRYGAVGI